MAICNFRADAFGFETEETMDFQKIFEYLERADREELFKKNLDPSWTACFDTLKARGIVHEKDGKYLPSARGKALLNAWQAASASPKSR